MNTLDDSEPVAHWPAIVQKIDSQSLAIFELTKTLYPNKEIARADIGPSFVRLAREYPPIELPAKK